MLVWIRKSTSEQWQDKTTLKRNGKEMVNEPTNYVKNYY